MFDLYPLTHEPTWAHDHLTFLVRYEWIISTLLAFYRRNYSTAYGGMESHEPIFWELRQMASIGKVQNF